VDNVTSINKNVETNLDELERDGKPPYSFVFKGERVEMLDPHTMDFKDLMTIQHPANFLKFALSDEAKKLLAENKLEGWKFNRLIEDYMKYYDLDPERAGKGWLS
jgi:hypothetical protein